MVCYALSVQNAGINPNSNLFVISFLCCSLGIPLIVVIGQKAAKTDDPQFELHFTATDTSVDLSLPDLIGETVKFTQVTPQ